MFKVITGVIAGYFLYTEDGRNTINEIGIYIKNTIQNSINELNKSSNKNNNTTAEKENARTQISLPQNERRDTGSERVYTESVGLQKECENEIRGISFNSSNEDEYSR